MRSAGVRTDADTVAEITEFTHWPGVPGGPKAAWRTVHGVSTKRI
jgi:hypothetical protein